MAEIVGASKNGSQVKVVYSYTQNVNKNQSTLTLSLYAHRDSYGPSWDQECNAYIRVDGSNVMTYDGSFRIGSSWVKIGSTVTKTVTHNADGTKSVTSSGFFDGYNVSEKVQDLSCSGTVTLKTIPRASSITSITGNTIGETVTVKLSRASSSFTHRLYYTFGDKKNHLLSSNVATSYSFKPPLSDCSYIPTATSGTATIRADTYNGSTKIGSASKNFTLKVPASVAPTLSGVTVTRVDGTVPSDWGIFVKGKSKATVQVTGAAGAYGSTIKSYAISGGGYSGATNPFTTGILNTAGEVSFTAKITDTRGRTVSGSASITVEDYDSPVITDLTAFRCDENGGEQDDGAYASITAVFSGSTLGGKNPITGQYRTKAEGGSWSGWTALTSGTAAIALGISPESTYTVEVEVSDAFTSVSRQMTINAAQFIMDFKAGGSGIAFGKAAEYDDLLDVQWDARFRGGVAADGPLSTENPVAVSGSADEADIWQGKGLLALSVEEGQLLNQPTDRGLLLCLSPKEGGQAHLLWMPQPDGSLYHRGCDADGWGSGWREGVDSKNLSHFLANATGNIATNTNPMNNVHVRSIGSAVATLSFYCANADGSQGNSMNFLKEPESSEGRTVLRCSVNGGAYLGTTSYRWNTGFFTNTITQSDVKEKENIAGIPNAKAFILALEPISYTLKNGDGGRVHMGFAAQAVAQAAAQNHMGDLSLYQAAVVGEDGTERYYQAGVPDEQLSWGLNYHEFIAPLVALAQEQEARIAALEAAVGSGKPQTE